ncbi:MAG: DNA cytosine methyltransferase [Clostridiales bacterium]|nr:DNA cytosine methyltransferase [Clostridiales bacterium]
MRIVDLFSGAGGLTFGFYYKLVNGAFVKNLNNQILFANEFDDFAAEAFRANFNDIDMQAIDIKKLNRNKIRRSLNGQKVDLIIGGPPCQSFSTVGKRRYDDKAKLYQEYLRVLNIIKPQMFLFENVKGILSMKEIFYELDEHGKIKYYEKEAKRNGKTITKKVPKIIGYGDFIMDKLKKQFDEIGYRIEHKVLNAGDFGVPQSRERVFIIGIRKDLNIVWQFPQPILGYHLTIKDAIGDLPLVREGKQIKKYNIPCQNKYQQLMRGGCDTLTLHSCGKYGDKIRTVIKNVKQGQGKNDFNALVDEGIVDEKYRLTSGYANTYGRLVENEPSTTITNNLSTPSSLRCIHYSQNRALTSREGARIQSFPDWFKFEGNRTEVNRQIGNAVPPLLALAIAENLSRILEGH